MRYSPIYVSYDLSSPYTMGKVTYRHPDMLRTFHDGPALQIT